MWQWRRTLLWFVLLSLGDNSASKEGFALICETTTMSPNLEKKTITFKIEDLLLGKIQTFAKIEGNSHVSQQISTSN